jgi:hypothetical protein
MSTLSNVGLQRWFDVEIRLYLKVTVTMPLVTMLFQSSVEPDVAMPH